MHSIINDIQKCRNNYVSVDEARNVMSLNVWKTARRIVEILYDKKGHTFIQPESKLGNYVFGEPIHGLNSRLITSHRSIQKIQLDEIPESDKFWTQEGKLWIESDDFELNNMFAFRLKKSGTKIPSIQNIGGNTQSV